MGALCPQVLLLKKISPPSSASRCASFIFLVCTENVCVLASKHQIFCLFFNMSFYQVGTVFHISLTHSPELSSSQNTPVLPSYKIIGNNVLLTSKEFSSHFWLIALNEGSKDSHKVVLSFYDQLYVYDLNAFLSLKRLRA